MQRVQKPQARWYIITSILLIFLVLMMLSSCGNGSSLKLPNSSDNSDHTSESTPSDGGGDSGGGIIIPIPDPDHPESGGVAPPVPSPQPAPVLVNGLSVSADNGESRTITYQRLLIKANASNTSNIVISSIVINNPTLIENSAGQLDNNANTCQSASLSHGNSCYLWLHALKQNDIALQNFTLTISYKMNNKTESATIFGSSGNVLYVGGLFTQAGDNTQLKNLVKWDGIKWNSVGGGANGNVKGLNVDSKGNLYIGGAFDYVGYNAQYTNKLAMWNGWQWFNIGVPNPNGDVNAVAVTRDGNVFIGGDFTLIAGHDAYHIARFDGKSWQDIHSGITINTVNTIVTDSNSQDSLGNSIYVLGSDKNIYMSDGTSAQWKSILTINNLVTTPFIVTDGTGKLYTFDAATATEIYTSLFGTYTFTTILNSLMGYNQTAGLDKQWYTLMSNKSTMNITLNNNGVITNSNPPYQFTISNVGLDLNGSLYMVAQYNLCNVSSMGFLIDVNCPTQWQTSSANPTLIKNYDFSKQIPIVTMDIIPIKAFAVMPNNDMYFAGVFSQIGITAMNNIGKISKDSTISTFGSGINGVISSMVITPQINLLIKI